MTTGNINPDLLKERKRCTFDPLELTHLIDGGKEKTEDRRTRGKMNFVVLKQVLINVIYFYFFGRKIFPGRP